MSGVYLGRGSAPSDGTGIGSVITQHAGIHLLLQLIAGGKELNRKNVYQVWRAFLFLQEVVQVSVFLTYARRVAL